MKKIKGISLIVLIITIVVIIILSSAMIISLTKTNIIQRSNEAAVKQNFGTLQEELDLYISNKYIETKGSFQAKKFTVKTNDTNPSIDDVLPSLKRTKYYGKVTISKGKLVLKEIDDPDYTWALSVIDRKSPIDIYEQKINYQMLYDGSLGESGEDGANVCSDITGSFQMYTTNNANTLTFASNAIKHYNNGAVGTNSQWAATIYSNNSIDISGYEGLLVIGNTTCNRDDWHNGTVLLSSIQHSGAYGPNGNYGNIMEDTTKEVAASIYVTTTGDYVKYSKLQKNEGSYYLNEICHSGTNSLEEICLIKSDEYKKLCEFVELNPDDYSSEEELCSDSTAIGKIVNDEQAVEYMVKQCTGSFMASFLKNSTAVSSYENSEYKSKIDNNVHWGKFLNAMNN